MHQIASGGPDPLGSSQRPPDTLAVFRNGKGGEESEEEETGREG